MERIVYKIALDVSKPESQKHLTGFSIGETRARRLIISLMNGRIPVQFDGTEIVSMFVTKPSDVSPSIGLCSLDGSNIIYDVLQSDVSEDGVIKFTIKVQHNDDGNISILYAAHFDIQVTDPECDDSHAPDDPNYSLLELLVAEVEQLDLDSEAWAVGTRNGEPVTSDDPAYENNSKFYAEHIGQYVKEQVQTAEAWAVGTRGGVPVTSGDPTYDNNSKYYKEQAATSATNAATSETNAEGFKNASKNFAVDSLTSKLASEGFAVGEQGGVPVDNTSPYYHNNAKHYKEKAATSATNAATSELNASGSATSASGSASSASTNALKAEGFAVGEQGGVPVDNTSPYYHNNAKHYEEQAATSATNAGTSETNAANSALAASGSASTASNKALDSEAWAVGERGGSPVAPGDPTYDNSAKYWAGRAAQGQIQADWNQTDNTQKDFIKNKNVVEEAISVNMIPYPYSNTSKTQYGVHWTVKADGTLELYTDADGATRDTAFVMVSKEKQHTIPDGSYIVSSLNLGENVTDLYVIVDAYVKNDGSFHHTYGSTKTNGGKFTKSDGDTYYTTIMVTIKQGKEILTPITLKPMLEIGNIAHSYVEHIAEGKHINEVVKSVADSIPDAQIQSDWNEADNTQPDFIKNKPTIPAAQIQSDWNQADNTQKDYIKNKPTIPTLVQSDWNEADNTQLDFIKNKPTIPTAEIEAILNVYGAKNLLAFPYADGMSKTVDTVTFTVNADGSIKVTGTSPSSDCDFYLAYVDQMPFESGHNYVLSGCPSGGGASSWYIEYSNWVDMRYWDTGSALAINSNMIFSHATYPNQKLYIRVKPGATIPVGGITFYPMVRDARIADNTYVPYAMSNRQLTQLSYNNAAAHNSIYRGKYLGSSVTTEQWQAISGGTFEDLYIGDYWTINSVNWRIAAFDYYWNTGDGTPSDRCLTHHAVIVPDSPLDTKRMNATATVQFAYLGSEMYTTNLATSKTAVESAFGASHILQHRNYFMNTVYTGGRPGGGVWADSKVDLMNERNLYGSKIWGITNDDEPNIASQYTIDRTQFPLFAFNPSMITNGNSFWLRDIAFETAFAAAYDNGNSIYGTATSALGVRPAFSIKG